MTTKITVVYDNPSDPDAFEAAYPDQVALARKVPGLQGLESSKVWPKDDGSPTPAYRLLDLHFADYDAASDAVATDEAAALFPDIVGLATGGVRIVFAEVEVAGSWRPTPAAAIAAPAAPDALDRANTDHRETT